MVAAIESKAGIKNFNFLIHEQENVLAKMEAEYAKGAGADTKKLERYARQINAFFHSHDASTELMMQNDLAKALDETNEKLIKKQTNFLGQCLTSVSGGLGVGIVILTVGITFKAMATGLPFAQIEKVLSFAGQHGPMLTQGVEALSKAAHGLDQAGIQLEDHNMKSLTHKRGEGQSYRQNASSHVGEELRKLQEANAADNAAWNAAARA